MFDGECEFRTASADLARRRLHAEHIEPGQRLDLAVIEAFRSAGGPWPLSAHTLALPGTRQIAGIYWWVADRRSSFGGSTPAYGLPAPEGDRG